FYGNSFVKPCKHTFLIFREFSSDPELNHVMKSVVKHFLPPRLKKLQKSSLFDQIFQLIRRPECTFLNFFVQCCPFMKKHGKINHSGRPGPVKKLCGILRIFYTSALSGYTGHKMCIVNQPGFSHPVNLPVCLL